MTNKILENQSQAETSRLLWKEAQARVNIVATQALDILDKNPDAKLAIQKTFQDMISGNLRDPENIRKIQNWLYEARDARLANIDPSKKLSTLESFSRFMKGFTEQIAMLNRDIPLSNNLNLLTNATNTKIDQVKSTYAWIITNDHPTQTA